MTKTKIQRLVDERTKRSGIQNEHFTDVCWALKCEIFSS